MTILKNDPLTSNNPQIDPAVKSRHKLLKRERSKFTAAQPTNPAMVVGFVLGALVVAVGLFTLKIS